MSPTRAPDPSVPSSASCVTTQPTSSICRAIGQPQLSLDAHHPPWPCGFEVSWHFGKPRPETIHGRRLARPISAAWSPPGWRFGYQRATPSEPNGLEQPSPMGPLRRLQTTRSVWSWKRHPSEIGEHPQMATCIQPALWTRRRAHDWPPGPSCRPHRRSHALQTSKDGPSVRLVWASGPRHTRPQSEFDVSVANHSRRPTETGFPIQLAGARSQPTRSAAYKWVLSWWAVALWVRGLKPTLDRRY